MNIYDLNETNDIFNTIKSMCENETMGNKISIVRMYAAGKREYETMKLREQFEKQVDEKYIQDVVILDETSAIVSYLKKNNDNHECWYQPVILNNYRKILYDTFDETLIGMICLKTNNVDASVWIRKMLGINISQ